jgi:hypothetical protein
MHTSFIAVNFSIHTGGGGGQKSFYFYEGGGTKSLPLVW